MKFKNIFLLIIASLLICCKDFSSKPDFTKSFIKVYGGSEENVLSSVEISSDGGYILIGTSLSFGNGSQMIITKTDQFGNQQWQRDFGEAGADSGRAIKQTPDGGYIAIGSFQDTVSKISSMYVVKMDNMGLLIWSKKYNESPKRNAYGHDIAITKDQSNYLLGGSILNPATNTGIRMAFVRKIDANGEQILPVPQPRGINGINTMANSIYEGNDSGIDWIGTGGILNSQGGSQNISPIFVRLNKSGNEIFAFDKTAPNIKSETMINANVGLKTSDGGYIIHGTSINSGVNKAYLLKLTEGNSTIPPTKSWFNEFGNGPTFGSSVCETSDGGFAIVGSTFGDSQNSSNGGSDIYLARIDKMGNKVWEKTFGGTSNDLAAGVKQTKDGGFVISGTMSLITTPNDNKVMCLIKVDSNGDLTNK